MIAGQYCKISTRRQLSPHGTVTLIEPHECGALISDGRCANGHNNVSFLTKGAKTTILRCSVCESDDVVSLGSKGGVLLMECTACKKRYVMTGNN